MRDLTTVIDLDLYLPIRGKTYHVKPPSAAVGADLQNRLAAGLAADAGVDIPEDFLGQIVIPDGEVPNFARLCLGDAYDQMVTDGLDQVSIEFCTTTAFLAWTVNKEFAEHWWETGGKVKGRPAPPYQPGQPPTETPTLTDEADTTT